MGVRSMNLAHLVVICGSPLLLPLYPMELYHLMGKTYRTIIIQIASKQTFRSISALWAIGLENGQLHDTWSLSNRIVFFEGYK